MAPYITVVPSFSTPSAVTVPGLNRSTRVGPRASVMQWPESAVRCPNTSLIGTRRQRVLDLQSLSHPSLALSIQCHRLIQLKPR